jgi:phage-related minor tail protein
MASLSSLNIKVLLDGKQFSSQIKNMERSLTKFGKKMSRTGEQMTKKMTLPIIGLGAASLKVFADFEQGMANVKAVSGATESEFKALEATAKELGRTTKYTATEVAELELNYSKLGFSADEINKVAKSTLKLAQATGEDLADSAGVAGSTLRGFGLDASQMQMVVDVMAKSFSSSALDLEKFKTAMATVAPVAKNSGQSIQGTTAMLSILADRGMDASTAGTSMRNIFLTLAEKGMTLQEAMDKVRNSTNQNATAMELFGKRGATAAIMLANNQEETAKLTEKYMNSAGAAEKMAAIMDDTMMGSLLRLKSALEGAAIEIGQSLKPMIDSLAERIASLAGWFTELDEGTKKTILTLAGIAAAIGPVIFLIGKLSLAFKALMTTNPILLALTAVVAVVIVLINKMGGLSAAWKKVSSFAVASAKTIVERFKNVGSVIAKIFQNLTKTIMAPLKAASLAAKGDFEGAKKALEQNIISPFSGINKIWEDGTKKINGYWTELDKLKDKQEKVADSTKQITNATKELNQTIASGGSGGSGRISSLSTATARGVGGDLATSQQGVKKLELQRADNGDMEWAYTIDNSKIVDMQGGLTQVADMTSDWTKKMQETAQEFNDTVPYLIKDGLYDLTTGLGEATGNLLSGQGSMQDVFNTILMSLADFGKQFGEMLIGIGLAKIALETSLKTMQPWAAIAAGTALIALSTAAKNFVAKGIPGMATGGIASGGLTLVGERGPELVNMPRGATVRNATATANMMGGSGELTTKISGRDLEIILNRTKAQSLRR